MKPCPCLKTALPSNGRADILGAIRPIGALILIIALFVAPVSADTIVCTLDAQTIPDNLQCGEIWNEGGLDLVLRPHPPLCFAVELCDFISNPDNLAFSPAILDVDLTGILGTVTSAVVFATSLCSCVKVVFYDGTTVVDSIWGGALPADTLMVFTSGMPVDRLAIEGCYSTTVHEIHIEFDPTPTGIGPTPYARGVPLESRPNPFNTTTQISFDLETGGQVQLLIYDVKGRVVRSLVDTELVAGPWSGTWDGRDASGRRLATGVYFARLAVNGRIAASRKVVITR
jgi:hypothetical protein